LLGLASGTAMPSSSPPRSLVDGGATTPLGIRLSSAPPAPARASRRPSFPAGSAGDAEPLGDDLVRGDGLCAVP
jgi:hypothetical protein